MKIVDCFAGLRGWSRLAEKRGHEVWSFDNDPQFDVSCIADVLDIAADPYSFLPWQPDLILASPPCEGFTVMQIGRNWWPKEGGPNGEPPHSPKTDKARLSLSLVQATRMLIDKTQPAFFVIENPVGKLRRLEPVADLENHTITYCQYGENWRKPTDLWGGFPPSLKLLPKCDTSRRPQLVKEIDGVGWVCDPNTGTPCHLQAKAGSRNGIQAMNLSPEERAKVPDALAEAVIFAAEQDIARLRT